MATENEIISQAVKGALEEIQKNAPEEFARMSADPKVRNAVTEAARAAATEEVKLAHEFSSRPDQDIRERLAKYLPEDRIKLIEESLSIPTFRMDITQKSDGKYLVQITREGTEFLPAKELNPDIQWASILQQASIVVEAVFLVMSAVGISVAVSEITMRTTIEDTERSIENSSAFKRAFENFVSSWNDAGGNAWKRSIAIFILVKETYIARILWNIMKILCTRMTFKQWLITVAKVTAMIIATFATGGVALTAEIALVVMSAYDFIRKLDNLEILQGIKHG